MAAPLKSFAAGLWSLAAAAGLAIAPAAQAQVSANFDAADADHDGHLTFDEFQAYATRIAAASSGAMAATFNQRTPADQAARLHLRFDAADTDHKGYLTRAEFDAMAAGVPAPSPAAVTVLPFAVLGQTSDTSSALARQACAAVASSPQATPPDPATVKDLTDQVAQAVAKAIHAKAQVPADVAPQAGPAGTITLAGCLTVADAGNGAARLVGFGLGASKLHAHVQLYRNTGGQLEKLGEFDAAAEGANTLPAIGPIGLVLHGAKSGGQTLAADVDKLGTAIADTALKTVGL